jgi:hypothetical protein
VGNPLQLSLNTFFSRSAEDGFNQEGGGTAFFRLTRTPPIVDLARTDSRGRLLIRPNLQGGGAQNENALYSLQNVGRLDVNEPLPRELPGELHAGGVVRGRRVARLRQPEPERARLHEPRLPHHGPEPEHANNGSLQNYAGGQESVNGSVGIAFPNVKALPDLLITPTRARSTCSRTTTSASRRARSSREQRRGPAQLAAGPAHGQAIRQSTRQLTYQGGLQLEYKERYILTATRGATATRRSAPGSGGPPTAASPVTGSRRTSRSSARCRTRSTCSSSRRTTGRRGCSRRSRRSTRPTRSARAARSRR